MVQTSSYSGRDRYECSRWEDRGKWPGKDKLCATTFTEKTIWKCTLCSAVMPLYQLMRAFCWMNSLKASLKSNTCLSTAAQQQARPATMIITPWIFIAHPLDCCLFYILKGSVVFAGLFFAFSIFWHQTLIKCLRVLFFVSASCLENKNKLCSLTCGGCFTRISREDPTPKKVLTPCQDLSVIDADFAYKTFSGVGSLEIQGSNPEESLDTLPRPIRHRCWLRV